MAHSLDRAAGDEAPRPRVGSADVSDDDPYRTARAAADALRERTGADQYTAAAGL